MELEEVDEEDVGTAMAMEEVGVELEAPLLAELPLSSIPRESFFPDDEETAEEDEGVAVDLPEVLRRSVFS